MNERWMTSPPRTASILRVALALAVMGGLSACGTTGGRAERQGRGAPPLHAESDGYGHIHLPAGARILVLGDDYVGTPAALPGATFKPPKGKVKIGEPYTVELAKALGPQVTLIVRTQPGARIEKALADFDSLPKADAVVMLFGPGDAWGGPAPLPAAQFSSALRQLLAKAGAAGSLVVVVSPPPVSAPGVDINAITAYRTVVGVQGSLVGANVIEFAPGFRQLSHLWSDGVHLDTPGSRAVARNVAAQFIPPPSAAK